MHNRHTIQKQVLHLETGEPSASLGFERQARDLYYELLLPKMETLFDRYAGPHSRIRMEKLEVEVTLPYSDAWEERFCDAVLQEIEMSLRGAVRQEMANAGAPGPMAASPPATDVEAVFLYFLSNGIFPWYASEWTISSVKEYFTESRIKTFLRGTAEGHDFWSRLVSLLATDRHALSRLCSQFSDNYLRALFSGTSEYKIMERWFSWIEAIGKIGISAFDGRLLAWKILLSSLARTGGKIEASVFSETEKDLLLRVLASISREAFESWWKDLSSPSQKVEIWRVLACGQLHAEDSVPSDITDLIEKDVVPKKPRVKDHTERPEQEGVYIQNAGLVLLHPFLQALFIELGCFDGVTFVSEEMHQRAVLLTQSMVYPGEEYPEDQLLLNKVLCGYDPEQTLPCILECMEKETEETESLLEAVIKHWTMNGVAVNTTVDNLRAAFLQRPGKLIRRSDDWLLKVEGAGYDIVMKNLPWGIGMIKHAWMPEMLRVEWV